MRNSSSVNDGMMRDLVDEGVFGVCNKRGYDQCDCWQ